MLLAEDLLFAGGRPKVPLTIVFDTCLQSSQFLRTFLSASTRAAETTIAAILHDPTSRGATTLLVDLTDALVTASDPTPTYKDLASIPAVAGALKCSVVAFVQGDVLESRTIKSLQYLADLAVFVEPCSDGTDPFASANDPQQASLVSIQRMSGGKVRSEVSTVRLSEQKLLFHTSTPVAAPPNNPPAVLATFNLGLSDAQRSAKNRLVLPYTRRQRDTPSAGAFDDEDPDVDLDL